MAFMRTRSHTIVGTLDSGFGDVLFVRDDRFVESKTCFPFFLTYYCA